VFSFAHSKAINNHKKDSRRDRFEIRIARRSVAHWREGRGGLLVYCVLCLLSELDSVAADQLARHTRVDETPLYSSVYIHSNREG
jgi:hypothetical protein